MSDLPGMSRPVVPELLSRLQMHSPGLYTQLCWYMDHQDESVPSRVTHDGTDASASLSLQLLEVLISFTKIRMEILDQVSASGGKVPGNIQLALSEILSLEPVLLQAATSAMELHLNVWDAHAAPWSSSSVDSSPQKEERGRWVRAPKHPHG